MHFEIQFEVIYMKYAVLVFSQRTARGCPLQNLHHRFAVLRSIAICSVAIRSCVCVSCSVVVVSGVIGLCVFMPASAVAAAAAVLTLFSMRCAQAKGN